MLWDSTVGGSEDVAAARERAFAAEDAVKRAGAEASQLRTKLTHLEQVKAMAVLLWHK